MARYFPMDRGHSPRYIWNIDFGVGEGRANRPDDVQLIQHCFNRLLGPIDFFDKEGRPIVTYLKRDGLFGPKTGTAIWAFQTHLKNKGRFITVDGAVDPSDQTGYTKKDMVYTMVHFNVVHLQVHGAMMDENSFPEPLKTTATHSLP